jgi:predicted kinase
MFDCAAFTKHYFVFFIALSTKQNYSTSYSIRSGIDMNISGGGSSTEIGNGNIDDGWADVSRKKKERSTKSKASNKQKNSKPKQHDPYIEQLLDPTSNNSNDRFEPFMILLVGLPGSGKSTFAQSLVASMPNKFCRINQDELKSRPKCERRLKQVLSVSPTSSSQSQPEEKHRRLCPIIDRCNFDAQQRRTWYRLAEEAVRQESSPTSITTTATPGADTTIETGPASAAPPTPKTGIPIDVVVLDLPYEECLRRCEMRKGHETIKSPQQAAGVLKQLRRQWSPPHHRKNKEEKSRYRSLTIVRTDRERKDCLIRLLKQTF